MRFWIRWLVTALVALFASGAYAHGPSSPLVGGGNVAADHIDDIDEIAAALKTGVDAKLITGTAGATDDCAKFNSDGDLVGIGAACGAATLPIVDSTAVVKGSVDPTKLVRIEADGLTGGTTRVITMPDFDVTLGPTAINDLGDATASGAVQIGTNAEYGQVWTWDWPDNEGGNLNAMTFSFAHKSTSGANEQVGLTVRRLDGAGTQAFESLIRVVNLEESAVVENGIEVRSSAGTIITAFDASDAELVNAISVGQNDVLIDGNSLLYTEFEQLLTLGASTISATDWALLAELDGGTPAINCADCSNIPAGSHSDTIEWTGTPVLESGATFGFGDGTDATLTHTYGVTGTDPVVVYSDGAITVTGAFVATSVGVSDKTSEPGNKFTVNDNDTAFTNDPTCANSGTAGQLTLIDVDEGADEDWQFCDGLNIWADIVETGSDIIAAGQIMVGQTTTGEGLYVDVSGDAALANDGTFTASERLYRDEFAIIIQSGNMAAGEELVQKANGAITLVRLSCVANGSTISNVTVNVVECTQTGASCVSNTTSALTVNDNTSDFGTTVFGGAGGSGIDVDDWWGIELAAITLEAEFLFCTVEYTRDD